MSRKSQWQSTRGGLSRSHKNLMEDAEDSESRARPTTKAGRGSVRLSSSSVQAAVLAGEDPDGESSDSSSFGDIDWDNLPELTDDMIVDAAAEKGTLRVLLQRGSGLKAADKGGTSDPYVVVGLGKAKKRSAVLQKTLEPQWDESFNFACSTSEGLLYGACVTAYLPVAGAVSYPGPGSSVSQVSQ